VAEKVFAAVLTDRDRIMARITTGHGGTVDHYSLQFECRLGDSQEWTIIRRYDSATVSSTCTCSAPTAANSE
jgi:hypothetical protein